MAVEKILLQFEADIKDLKSELANVKSQLGNVEKQTEQTGSKMTNTFKNVGRAIATAFTVREVVRFAQETEKLARQAEGVKKAFDNIATAGTLEKLREATRGTVSDLQLMQNAVKASNFQIPLDQLGKLFSFANQRARETGESVDYLVDSIVLGIGRKSPLILDNLGISAVRLRSEFKGLGVETAEVGDVAAAVGRIIDEEMAKAANSTTDAADAADRAKASFENLKVEIGQRLLPVLTDLRIGFNRALEDIINLFDPSFETSSEKIAKSIERINIEIEYGDRIRAAAATNIQRYKQSIADLDAQLANTKDVEKREEIITKIKEQSLLFTQANEKEIESMSNSEDALKATAFGLERANDYIQMYTSSLIAGAKPTDDLTKKTSNLSESLGTTTEKAEKYVSWLSKWLREQREIRIENSVLKEALGGLQFTIDDTTQGIKGMSEAWKENYEQNKKNSELMSTEGLSWIEKQIIGLDALQNVFGSYGQLLIEIAGKQSALAEFGRQLAFFEIATAQAVAIANAVKTVSQSSKTPIDYFVFLATMLSSIAVNIGKARSLIEKDSVPQFATGVVDLKGAGTETSDSIHAKLSRGESVITAKGTRQDKGLFEAANKLQLEKYINENYVLPALIKVNKERSAMFDDYRLYRELRNSQGNENKNFDRLIRTINRKKTRYDWN